MFLFGLFFFLITTSGGKIKCCSCTVHLSFDSEPKLDVNCQFYGVCQADSNDLTSETRVFEVDYVYWTEIKVFVPVLTKSDEEFRHEKKCSSFSHSKVLFFFSGNFWDSSVDLIGVVMEKNSFLFVFLVGKFELLFFLKNKTNTLVKIFFASLIFFS